MKNAKEAPKPKTNKKTRKKKNMNPANATGAPHGTPVMPILVKSCELV